MPTREEVIAAIAPLLSDPPASPDARVVEVVVLGRDVTVTLTSSGPREELGKRVREALAKLPDVGGFEVRWHTEVRGRNVGPDDPLPEVKNVVLVMSGKGGVGKSTCATNLTMSLHRAGFRVGLLDADIYGPSIPTMLGVSGRPVSLDGKRIEPLERFGVKLMSIGFLLEDPKAAIVWRGPMLHGALLQFLKDVHWGALDYLILDLPPGTGDVALTLAQRVTSPYAVIVTTPQPVATDDVYKSVSMCEKVNIPVVGVIENMSYFVDSAGVSHELFGRGGGQAVADFAKAPLLGQVPIDQSVREWGDKGTPVVQAAPFSAIARAFVAVAERLTDAIDARREGGEEEAPPEIDRSGGTGGRKRLPIMK
ncbi:MAG TPA: Mrp/NBP35 family ATP-binding protein [Polyangiaceae bacterium]|nr:Mrp/NBP35 family ATP-binding protein [Polyangiaceae bacterium]